MATRPIFIADLDSGLVRERIIDFKWVPGMARSQAQKCIASLHEAACKQQGISSILEISSKSEDPNGVSLSAFNLFLSVNEQPRRLECVYQASKVFEQGGPFRDLLTTSPIDAKRDVRLQSNGSLTGFYHNNSRWSLRPQSAFYDWLYVNALCENENLAAKVLNSDAFTDIAFNPKKSISCQARSAALYKLLYSTGRLSTAVRNQDSFLSEHQQSFNDQEEGFGGTLF